jgi:hypothetical protein
MAAMPRTRKPAGTAVDVRNGRRADLEATGAQVIHVDLPRPRQTYQSLALTAWDGYWSRAVAATVTEADLMVVHVWIDAYDDALAKRAQADLEPLVEGSMGQLVANPLYAVAHQQMVLAMQCAKQLGIGARNRADLGIAIFTGQEKQRAAAAEPEGDEDDSDDDDPRRVTAASG